MPADPSAGGGSDGGEPYFRWGRLAGVVVAVAVIALAVYCFARGIAAVIDPPPGTVPGGTTVGWLTGSR